MLTCDPSSIIHFWKCPQTLYAVKEDNETAFYIQSDEKINSYHLIKKAIGWIEPRAMSIQRQKIFYDDFKPILLEHNSLVIFCLFIRKISGLLVGYLDNRKFCVHFFPENGQPFLLEKIHDISLPTYEDGIESNLWYWRKNSPFNEYLPITIDEQEKSLQVKTIQLFAKSFTGATHTIEIKANASIETLKNLIEDKTRILPKSQKLIFAGKQLEESTTLLDWNIQKESTIHIVLALTGGGLDPFSFSHMEKEKRVSFGTQDAPFWSYAAPGLTLLGTCDNPDCQAFNERICIQKGMGAFDMDRETTMSQCPACSQIANNVNTPFFYACLFSIVGKKEDGSDVERLDIRAPDDEFLMFESESDSDVIEKWESLVITTKSIPAAPKYKPSNTSTKPPARKGCTLF